MPCVYLPGPAPAVTVANTNVTELHRHAVFLQQGLEDIILSQTDQLLHISSRCKKDRSAWSCTCVQLQLRPAILSCS